MIDPVTMSATQTRPDAGYSSWTASMNKAVMRLDPEDRTAGPIPTFGSMVHETALAAQTTQAYAPMDNNSAVTAKGTKPDIAYTKANDDEYTFADVLDVVNPLQHLPVIGTLYRKLTGDVIKPMSAIIGDAIFGGPVGAVAGTVNALVKTSTGKDVAENALSLVGIDVTPNGAQKPNLTYDKPVNVGGADLAGTTLALANLSPDTKTGIKNFAAKTFPTQIWNA